MYIELKQVNEESGEGRVGRVVVVIFFFIIAGFIH